MIIMILKNLRNLENLSITGPWASSHDKSEDINSLNPSYRGQLDHAHYNVV